MKYVDMSPIGRKEAQEDLDSGVPERVSEALVRLSLHDPERAYVGEILAAHLKSHDAWVRRVAATCVGHVARIHRSLDSARFVPLLEKLRTDERTVGSMNDALEDIDAYVVRDPNA